MRAIKIIAISEAGTIAINKHIAESFRLKRREKMTFTMLGFKQEIISQNPLILELSMNNRIGQLVKADDFSSRIQESLKENNAMRDIDYRIEVE